MNYKELIQIKELYNQTETETIKANIKQLMKDNNVKHSLLVELLDISSHTAYSYTNAANKGKPDIFNLLILSDYFNIDIVELFKDN